MNVQELTARVHVLIHKLRHHEGTIGCRPFDNSMLGKCHLLPHPRSVPAALFLAALAQTEPGLVIRLYGNLWVILVDKRGLGLISPAGATPSQ